jgi:hypothetical protein
MPDTPDNDETVPVTAEELTGAESGSWRVVTRDSSHLFDLDERTVTRIPGPSASPTVNDRTRPLRHLHLCRVGLRGHWLMEPDSMDSSWDHFWHLSSLILRIERIPPTGGRSEPEDGPGDEVIP